MGWGPGARGQGPGGARTFPRPLRWWRLGVEGTLQKLALRRKKALNAQEMEPDWLRRRLGAPSTPPCSKIRRGRGCELDDPKHFAFLPLPLLESRRPRAELGLEGGDHARPLSLSRLAWARRAPCARRLSLQDPSGPADAARGAPRRPPDAPSVCRAEAADRAPGPCGRVCPHRACLSQEGLFLPRTGASAGPSFSWAPGLQPLWFCSTAPLPCTCLSPGPLGPSSSLAARSLLLQKRGKQKTPEAPRGNACHGGTWVTEERNSVECSLLKFRKLRLKRCPSRTWGMNVVRGSHGLLMQLRCAMQEPQAPGWYGERRWACGHPPCAWVQRAGRRGNITPHA
ncbi:uncharacterized protein LOC124226918 isoform X1 [Equus quagga]|uniref:uncharacterized protein LOC124226918 isoform X1 n=1 Tax=Equus quagga TaxID=89248 RepID=UPI001EE16E39|nr:uncharacterized protein LOC124226918 isoform X1 [Equus quagga]